MKILLIILLTFSLPSQCLLGQTKAEIIKFNIVKVDTETNNGNWRTQSSAYYDKHGNQVMYTIEGSEFKYILYSEYRDTLLVKHTEVNYRDKKFVDSLVTRFSYKFDSKGRIIEDRLTGYSGEVRINSIIYKDNGENDTTYRYTCNENDSVFKLMECCKYDYKDGRPISYCFDSLGWSSPNVIITESYISDTLHTFSIRECNINNNNSDSCKPYFMNIYYDEGRIVRFEDEKQKILNVDTYTKNAQGLVYKHVARRKSPDNESTQIDTMIYYFRH